MARMARKARKARMAKMEKVILLLSLKITSYRNMEKSDIIFFNNYFFQMNVKIKNQPGGVEEGKGEECVQEVKAYGLGAQ